MIKGEFATVPEEYGMVEPAPAPRLIWRCVLPRIAALRHAASDLEELCHIGSVEGLVAYGVEIRGNVGKLEIRAIFLTGLTQKLQLAISLTVDQRRPGSLCDLGHAWGDRLVLWPDAAVANDVDRSLGAKAHAELGAAKHDPRGKEEDLGRRAAINVQFVITAAVCVYLDSYR